MKRRQWGRVESYASIALFEAMALAAGIEHTPLVQGRRIDRSEIARIYGELRSRSEESLVQVASSAWSQLYESELQPIR